MQDKRAAAGSATSGFPGPWADSHLVPDSGVSRKQRKRAAIESWEGEGGSVIQIPRTRRKHTVSPTRYSYAFPARWVRLSPLTV